MAMQSNKSVKHWHNFSALIGTNIFRGSAAKRCGIPTQTYRKTACIWMSGRRRRHACDTKSYTRTEMVNMEMEIITTTQTIITSTTWKVCRCLCGFMAADTWAAHQPWIFITRKHWPPLETLLLHQCSTVSARLAFCTWPHICQATRTMHQVRH